MSDHAAPTALDAACGAMQSGGETEALWFYRLLADAPLCLLLAQEAQDDRVEPQVFELTDGPVVLAFDTEDRLAGFQDSAVPYVTLPGRVIAQLMAGQGGGRLWLGLNLGTGAASETLLPPEALTHLLQLLDVTPELTHAQARQFQAPQVPEALDAALRFAVQAAAGLAGGVVLAGVSYANGARGHLLAFAGAAPGAEPALARAIAEALAFTGLEAGSLDVVFLTPTDPVLAAMARVGRSYEIAPPKAAEAPASPQAPGSDPLRPPRLR